MSSISSKAPGSSKMSVLLSQWSTARKTLEDEEEKAEQAIAETTDPVAMERKRERELQAWKQRQLESGQAAENANFQVRRTRASSLNVACAHTNGERCECVPTLSCWQDKLP